MIDLVVKLLFVIFTLLFGLCFAVWPVRVISTFNRWNGHVAPLNQEKLGRLRYPNGAFRQLGVLLITLTCYVVYRWLRGPM